MSYIVAVQLQVVDVLYVLEVIASGGYLGGTHAVTDQDDKIFGGRSRRFCSRYFLLHSSCRQQGQGQSAGYDDFCILVQFDLSLIWFHMNT
ncbi:hypothetical protein D3C75_1194010 [compost metagenome]